MIFQFFYEDKSLFSKLPAPENNIFNLKIIGAL